LGTPLGLAAPAAVIRMFEHEAHHRGQVATYLRLLGVEKPTGRDWRGPVYGR
jgi:hypothetical protein